jgi:ribosome-binding protein aMBF1 (putative translation factor)
MTISFADLKLEMLANPEVAAEYERLGPVYELVGAMVDARHAAGLTQGEIAAKIGTTQSAIARLENAHHLPSLDMVTRYASAVGRKLVIELTPAE